MSRKHAAPVAAELAAERAAAEADYPEWHVWVSDRGRWWAVRRGADASYSDGGRPMTVDADSAPELRALLAGLADGRQAGAP